MNDIIERAGELDHRAEPYALATVVAVDHPVSAKPGDRAIVTASGVVEGWVGGSCSEPIVVREAVAALARGTSRLVRIRPPGAEREPVRSGVVTEITACASEGGLDVFVEPRLPRPHLVVAGSSPISRVLAQLALPVGYRITAVVEDPSADAEDRGGAGVDDLAEMGLGPLDAVVVATMNRYDETALEAALKTDAGYVGLVSSRRRAAGVAALLRGRGADDAALARIRSPAGLDLGPSTQEEIALAIMAEIVAERHRRQAEDADATTGSAPSDPREAVDPVCGMTVAVVPTSLAADHSDETFYFCSPGCRQEFLAHPDQYTAAAG